MKPVVALVAFALLASAIPARACPRGPKQLAAARGTPHVDGDLDDAVWQTACFVDDFEQQAPRFGGKPTHKIKVAIAVDADTLYVGARMWSDGPDDVDDALTQRDDLNQAERFIVSLDPSNTKRVAYSFAVSVAGVRSDWIHTDDTQGNRDYTWNPVWIARTKRLADGWSAELAMPLAQLHLPSRPQASWGVDFNWFVPRRTEDIFWIAIPHDKQAWASMFGTLVDLPPIASRLGLEVLPYLAAHVTADEVRPAAPARRVAPGVSAGADFKLRPLPGLVVAGTVNPDFGQVDVDPAFVNLTAYEVQLAEKRPFFVENNALLANTGPNLFYSRRIGALPRALPSTTADGHAIAAIDLPQSVRILGALAAGGYVAERTQIAAIAAITDRTTAEVIDDAGHAQTVMVSPLTAYAIARVAQQVDNSVFGATATSVARALSGTHEDAILPATAVAASTDAVIRNEDRGYELDAFAGVTDVAGTAAAIQTVADSSAHYFQRPDASWAKLAPGATHMIGWTAGMFGSKRAGALQGDLGGYAESPRYEVNDLGRLQSADDTGIDADVTYLHTAPGARIYQWSVGSVFNQEWNFGGMRKPAEITANAGMTFTNFQSVHVDATYSTAGKSDDLTRGGPEMAVGWGTRADVAYASAPERRVVWSLNGSVDHSPTRGTGWAASGHLAIRATPALRLDLAPSLTLSDDKRQYLATVSDAGGGEATYGSRYVFGRMRRHEAGLELRATWSLSPDLVVTVYAQPFASVGRVDQIGELAAVGSADVRWYDAIARVGDGARAITDGANMFSLAEPDYTVMSLRSTAVLKWEPKPGSTLFVVWQQARAGDAATARTLHGALPDVFAQHAIHTLAVKFSYWFG